MADSQNKPAPHSPAKALQAPSAKLAEGADGEPSSREPSSRDPSSRELLAAIPERLEVPSANSAYSFELLAVACLMVLLPVLYVAIIAAVGWGVVWHFQHNTWLLNGDGSNRARGRGTIFLVLAYLAPGVVGVGLFITLLKPLFAGWWGGDDPRVPLERRDQPLLFAFVDRLCDALGSPRPHAIYVDEQANASAGLVGVSGLLTNRLQLTVGLPLVAGMPLRNLSGILAHEFGHFSQFWGMRLSGAINLVNAWLSHVVEHRDSVDEWVAAAASSLDLRIGWTLYLVQFANWLVRKLLRGLQLLGVLFSRRLMWQMEFHADAYEAELAGSETFRGTFTRLGLIMAANAMAREEFGHFASRKQLVDNFTLFTTGQVKLLKPEVRKAVRAHLSEDKSEWYETHPAPKDRIRVVEEAARPGVFTLDAPATALFRDFDGLCRTTTRKHYRQVLGRPVKETELTSAEMLVDELEETSQGLAATRRFVGGEPCVAHALHGDFLKSWDLADTPREESEFVPPPTSATLPLAEAPLGSRGSASSDSPDGPPSASTSGGSGRTAADWLAELRGAREQQRKWLATAAQAEERVRLALDEALRAHCLQEAVKHKLDTDQHQAKDGRAPIKTKAEAQQFLRTAQGELEAALREREPYVRAWSHRLWAALGLLGAADSAARLPTQGRLVAERDRIWPAVTDLSRGWQGKQSLMRDLQRMMILLMAIVNGRDDDGLRKDLSEIRDEVYESLKSCFRGLAKTPYPEPIEPRPESLGRACFTGIEDPDNLVSVMQAAGEFVDAVDKHWERVVGQAVLLATRVEQAWGLEPLPEVAWKTEAGNNEEGNKESGTD